LLVRLLDFTPKWTARKGPLNCKGPIATATYPWKRLSLEEIEGYRYRRLGQIPRRWSAGDLDGMLRSRGPAVLLQSFTRSNGSACEDIAV
jgi:hypothetical protein